MPIAPWGDHRAKVDGAQFEHIVAQLLREAGQDLPDFRLDQHEMVSAHDGQYRIDVTLRFSQLGVQFVVRVECKDHVRSVERDDVQVLADKTRAAGAHKGILFSTNGFQRGAIDYARSHGIALVRLLEGALTYETRSAPGSRVGATAPPWANIPAFVGQHISPGDDGKIHVSVVEGGSPDALARVLASA